MTSEIQPHETYHARMVRKIMAALHPIHLEIHDDSARHAGHSGHDPRGETHFIVTIASDAFSGLSLLARHRLVYAAVADELAERVHALNIKAISTSEYNRG